MDERFSDLKYLSGFGNYFSSESLPVPPFGLYTEQLSGTAFTRPRGRNRFVWLYRKKPSVSTSGPLRSLPSLTWTKTEFNKHTNSDANEAEYVADPNQMRWSPMQDIPVNIKLDFLAGVASIGKTGESLCHQGCHIYLYCFNVSMKRTFTNRDGDLLIVPQQGKILVQTEFGLLTVEPTEICVIQRGMSFQIFTSKDENSYKGYMLELYENHFELPELGPIGANGLANQRDFLTPVSYFDRNSEAMVTEVVVKFGDSFYSCLSNSSCFDVVAWHGNYVPFKYDLKKFCCMNSVTFDHPDPSIYTVLTCPSATPGTAVVDFVIFPPRWMVMEHTFRPPWFHRNIMTEYMGLIYGQYDAKEATSNADGFFPGGGSLHQSMAPHGPDKKTFDKAVDKNNVLKPVFFDQGLAFMFETCYPLKLSAFSRHSTLRQLSYLSCWNDFKPAILSKANEKQSSDHLVQWRKEAAKL